MSGYHLGHDPAAFLPPAAQDPSQNPAHDTQQYQPPSYAPPTQQSQPHKAHKNALVIASEARAKNEVQMQNQLQQIQMQYRIWNTEVEPEHETDFICTCSIHNYKRAKWARVPVQEAWCKAVMYPGEKFYTDANMNAVFLSNGPYQFRVNSPWSMSMGRMGGASVLDPGWHARWTRQTIALNAELNTKAQNNVDNREPKFNIWEVPGTAPEMVQTNGSSDLKASDEKKRLQKTYNGDSKSNSGYPDEKAGSSSSSARPKPAPTKSSKFSFRKALGMKSSEEKADEFVSRLRVDILSEEAGRWPDITWRQIVSHYQATVGMESKIASLRRNSPLQYLHLLRAGYFEPIPVAWAKDLSNPLKFSIEAAGGWRGITPAWRGYEDTAEERLYWVLNHREGTTGPRLKPDFISAMELARQRMKSAVEPPPQYFANDDTCHKQNTSKGYSKQVLPPAYNPVDRPESPNDDTMILLDVSGSMDQDPCRPNYNQYVITGYSRTHQPKNKDVAKAVVRRFTTAMSNHDHAFNGYDLVTFSTYSSIIGTINHNNFDSTWSKVKVGGGTRVMTGWQTVKDLHFRKHSESATHHPVYGWQAGPETPILRLLLLLDGEALDMDEFELDLLGCKWAHVTIFLIGADDCPHHHRHANELQRISDVNPHVSFVDAQGNCPERFVTHELLKRHLGYQMSLQEFEEIEVPPAYSVEA